MLYVKEIECIDKYDVVVVGGGPSGIGAAIAAAEQGARVLIIERCGILGGNLTVGHVGPTMGKYGDNTMAHRINQLLGCVDRRTQDFELAKIHLTEIVARYGIDVYLNTAVVDAVKNESSITHVLISTQSGLVSVEGKIFIDASGDGTLAYLCGEDYEIGREDGLVQPVSLMFIVGGVSPEQTMVCRHEKMDTLLKKGSYLELCKRACASGELPPEINIVRLYPTHSDTERMVNATQMCGVNGLSPIECANAQLVLRRQMEQVIEFLKNNVEGFENIYIKSSSETLGVRETRRIKGVYTLTAEDLIAGRRFDDVIVHRAHFPLDIHNPNGAGQAESEDCPTETQEYDIPYRVILPLKSDNLYLAGRCISGTHRAHASYRVMNTAMNIGEAAGIAAALCVKEGKLPRDLDVGEVQNALSDRKIDLFC